MSVHYLTTPDPRCDPLLGHTSHLQKPGASLQGGFVLHKCLELITELPPEFVREEAIV